MLAGDIQVGGVAPVPDISVYDTQGRQLVSIEYLYQPE
jgi:hypothetical protein